MHVGLLFRRLRKVILERKPEKKIQSVKNKSSDLENSGTDHCDQMNSRPKVDSLIIMLDNISVAGFVGSDEGLVLHRFAMILFDLVKSVSQ